MIKKIFQKTKVFILEYNPKTLKFFLSIILFFSKIFQTKLFLEIPIKNIDLPNKSLIKIKELSFFVIYENGIFFEDLFPIWIFPEPLKLLFCTN